MALEIIDNGNFLDDPSAEPIKEAWDKANRMFTELYGKEPFKGVYSDLTSIKTDIQSPENGWIGYSTDGKYRFYAVGGFWFQEELSARPAIANSYDVLQDLFDDLGSLFQGSIYYVDDASDDPEVNFGSAYYEYLGTVNGDLSDFRRIADDDLEQSLKDKTDKGNTQLTAGEILDIAEAAQQVADNAQATADEPETDPTVPQHVKDVTVQDVADWDEAFQKKAISISITGDQNKTLTLTREDGTILTAQFNDLGDTDPDDVLNTLNFNTSTGAFTAVTSEGSTISVNLDGRYALINHTHGISEINGLTTALSGKVDKVSGKQLTTVDFSQARSSKLDGIQSGAQVNRAISDATNSTASNVNASSKAINTVDNKVNDVKVTADNAFPKTGGNVSGQVNIDNSSLANTGFTRFVNFLSGNFDRTLATLKNLNNSVNPFKISVFGSQTDYNYAHMGFGDDFQSEDNLRIYKDGKLKKGNNELWDSSNLQKSEFASAAQGEEANTAFNRGDFRDFGLGGIKLISNADFNTLDKNIPFYLVTNATNAPINGDIYYVINLGNSSISSLNGIIALNRNNNRIYYRNANSTTWKSLTTPSDYATPTTGGTSKMDMRVVNNENVLYITTNGNDA